MIKGKTNKDKLQREQIFHTLFLLRVIISNCHLYSLENYRTKKMIGQAYLSLRKTLQTLHKLTILIIDNDIIINDKAVRAEEATHFSLFFTLLKQKNIGHIVFHKSITSRELHQFITDITDPKKTKIYNGPGISCGILVLKEELPEDLDDSGSGDSQGRGKGRWKANLAIEEKLKSLSNKQLLMAQELYFSMRKDQEFDIHGMQDIMASFIKLFSKHLNPLSILTPLKKSDDYTFTHIINVCILTLAQAESLGFTGQHLYQIGVAATLYDIGKTFIPDELLKKREKLDKKEQKIILEHAMKGTTYLLSIDDTPKLAVLAALEHHIRFGGGGYPNIGKNWKTNIVSQMIAIADTYDAMRCRRPYRLPSSEPLICKMMLDDNGDRYNPYLVKNFLKVLERNKTKTQTS